MKIKPLSYLPVFLGFFLTFFIVQQSYATLGQSTDSLASDKKVLMTVKSAKRTSSAYTVHELQSQTKTIREYASPSGVVFGIAWDGLTHPDLTPLLGNYASEHKRAVKNTPPQPGRRYMKIKSANIVVEKWGHMRHMQGRAYVPSLIPSGVSIDEIK